MATKFGQDSPFGSLIDKDVKTFEEDLKKIGSGITEEQRKLGEDQSAIEAGINKEFQDKVQGYKGDVADIYTAYQTRTSDRRQQAEDLQRRQEEAAGFQANIAAASADKGGRLSVGQLQSINKDITNQFAQSINNAIKDNINFQIGLDDKLSSFGLTVIDKNRILDEFSKTLKDEEAAPLLDALAATSKTRVDFMNTLGDTIKGINQTRIDESTQREARFERIEDEKKAFDVMDEGQRSRYVRDKFGATWNVLSSGQRETLIKRVSSGAMSLSEMNTLIKNMKDKAEQQKLVQQTATGFESLAPEALAETGQGTFTPATFTEGTAPRTSARTTSTRRDASFDDPEPTDAQKEIQRQNKSSQPYKVGNITYTSKRDYDALQRKAGELAALKRNDPAKFKEAVRRIKARYIIQ